MLLNGSGGFFPSVAQSAIFTQDQAGLYPLRKTGRDDQPVLVFLQEKRGAPAVSFCPVQVSGSVN